MALLPAFAVDGGRVPASMLRMTAWVATSGASGVVTPEDFKVQALPTPGGAVSINAGGAVIPTRYGNSTTQQSYAVANDQAFNLTIPAAGAAGRTEYVIIKINDPQYTGQTPSDPLTNTYCEVLTVASLPTTYPYLALAKIVLPANTATVTNAMITDMRSLAMPRRQRDTVDTLVTSGHQNLTTSGFMDFPTESKISVQVPSWATKAIIRCDLLDAYTVVGPVDGRFVLMLGAQPAYSAERRYDEIWTGSSQRKDYTIVAAFNIPESYRGTSRNLSIRGRRTAGTGNIRADNNTQVVYDIEFLESI